MLADGAAADEGPGVEKQRRETEIDPRPEREDRQQAGRADEEGDQDFARHGGP